jgi:dynein heavy chain 1, cytosolic
VITGAKLLEVVRTDLMNVKEMCLGHIKSTNDIKTLAQCINVDQIPKSWRKYQIGNITVNEWIIDFVKRVGQLRDTLSQSDDFGISGIWLGGLSFPGALLTATQQLVAQRHKWSLEELKLVVEIGVSKVKDD